MPESLNPTPTPAPIVDNNVPKPVPATAPETKKEPNESTLLQEKISQLEAENKIWQERTTKMEERLGNIQKGFDNNPEKKEPTKKELQQELDYKQALLEKQEYDSDIGEMMSEYGIPKERKEFFEFKLNKAIDLLDDEDEIPEEVMNTIVAEVLSYGKPANSSVQGANIVAPTLGLHSDITVEEFSQMSLDQRSHLYKEDRQTYNRLLPLARNKGLLVS